MDRRNLKLIGLVLLTMIAGGVVPNVQQVARVFFALWGALIGLSVLAGLGALTYHGVRNSWRYARVTAKRALRQYAY